MGKIVKDRIIYGGIDSTLQNKVGSAPLDTTAQDLSGAVNELKASGGGTITDVQVDGVSVVTSGVADIDLTGKADAATTLSGYGITDANINNGTITLGSNTITPLTSHQSVTDNNPTLSWGTKSKVATIGSTDIHVTMPSNPNTNTTYALYVDSSDNEKIKLVGSDGNSYSLTVPFATDSTTSTYALNVKDANDSATTTISKSGYSGTSFTNFAVWKTSNIRSATADQVKTALGLGSAAYLTANTAASNSTVVQRNSNGYVYANYFNTTCGAANPSSYTNSRALFTSDDGFIRKSTAANFRTMIGAVNKAGDDMSGNLTISVSGEGQVSTKSTAWGLDTSSNNGLSQNASAGAFYHKDKNNNIVARTNVYGQADGQTVICVQSYNRTTSNAEVMTGLWIWSKKNGAHAYSVTDAAAFRTGIGAAASSSRAYKENIQNMTEEEAKKILNVNIYSYDYKDGFGENNHNKNQFGVIAEEVIEQIPYAVNIPDKYDEEEALKSSNDPSKGGRNLITIDYWKFVPHLIKTVQIQEKRINELEEEIKAIKEAII